LTLNFSKSSFLTYKQCPAAYAYSYVSEGVPVEPDYSGVVPGKVIGRLLDNTLRTAQVPERVYCDGNKVLFDFLIDDKHLQRLFFEEVNRPKCGLHKDAWAKTPEDALRQLRAMRTTLLKIMDEQHVIQPYMLSEFRFASHQKPLRINSVVSLNGAIDLFVSEHQTKPGRLFDLKASPTDANQDPDELKLYTIAMQQVGIKVGMSAFLTYRGGVRTPTYYSFNKADLSEFEDKLVDTARRIAANEFPYTPSEKACKFCKARDICPSKWTSQDKTKLSLPLVKSGDASAPRDFDDDIPDF
jgi:hypothetical protein